MFLEDIVAASRAELAASQARRPLEELQRMAQEQPAALGLAPALSGDRIRLIAEVKQASPSRGVIRPDFDPVAIAQTYAQSGAAAISVLTEARYFKGSLNHLRDIRKAVTNLPLLRKDFILCPYQVYQARACGADSLLLIVAILTPKKLGELLELSHELGMDCLVEVHNEKELEIALASGARIIGINNRDLKTFNVDLDTTRRLRPLIPQDRIVVGESGIKDGRDMAKLKKWGVNAALVGEALMLVPDIAAKMKELL
jgi:indole-3-glycerol phosphate synthase